MTLPLAGEPLQPLGFKRTFVLLGLCEHYAASLLIVFVGNAVFYMALVSLHSLRDHITPFEIRSSAYGTVTAVLTPAAIVSMLAGSLLTEWIGVASVLLFAGIAAISSSVMVLGLGRKTVRSLQTSATALVEKQYGAQMGLK